MTPDSRAHIFSGADDYSMWKSISRIKADLSSQTGLEIKVERINGDETTPLKLIEACSAGDFFSSQRLIIVEGFLNRLDKAAVKAGEKKKKKTEMDGFLQLVNYIKQGLPPSVTVIFMETDSRKEKNPFFVQLSSVAKITYFAPLRGDALRKRIMDKVKEGGGKISPSAAGMLMNLTGGNLFALSHEIEKLILFTGGRNIEEEDVKRVTDYTREPTIFALVDSIIEKNKANSQNFLHQLLAQGEEPIYVIAMLARQLSFLVRTRDLLDKKTPLPEIQKKIGLKDFQWNKAVTQARGCSMEKLMKFYEILLNYDLSMKKGLLPKELALELLVSELWFV